MGERRLCESPVYRCRVTVDAKVQESLDGAEALIGPRGLRRLVRVDEEEVGDRAGYPVVGAREAEAGHHRQVVSLANDGVWYGDVEVEGPWTPGQDGTVGEAGVVGIDVVVSVAVGRSAAQGYSYLT